VCERRVARIWQSLRRPARRDTQEPPVTTLAPTLPLVNGTRIPHLGLGTWPLDDGGAEKAVATAIEAGYRLVDTAENYGNERGVGRGLRAAGVPREELFVTTKFNKRWHSVDGARQAFERSAELLGLDRIDLLLVHWPNPDRDRYVAAFEGLVALLRDGLVSAIGTSNFTPEHLRRVMDATGVTPDVNQVQLSPYVAQSQWRAYAEEHGIVVEGYSPIWRGRQLLDEPAVQDAARAHGRTPAQVVLRWHVQLGVVPVVKSADRRRQAENLAVFDFALTDEEMARLSALDRGRELATDPATFGH
jgi:2,5-diketo-D-gluconate reductase A